MTEYQELTKIKHSLLSKIEQHSNEEELYIVVQIEDYEFGVDTVVLLSDHSGLLLLDETYTEDHSSVSQAIVKAKKLHTCVGSWVVDMDVHLDEKIKEVSY